jgi:tetratricopeptide (TPR) repeat protein
MTQGGYWVIEGSIASGGMADIILLLITVAGGVFYLAITFSVALSTVGWGRLLTKSIPTPVRRSALGGWAAIGGTIVGLAMVTLFFLVGPQPSFMGDSPEVEALLEEATTYLSQGDFETGIPLLESAAREAPRSFSAHVMLGWGYYYTGEYANALAEFEIVQEIDPGMPESYLGKGYVQNAMDEFDAAQASFEQALILAVDDYSIAQAHHGLGEAFHFQQNLDEAIPHLEQAIRYDPRLSLAYLELSFAYSGRGEFYNAISQCEILAGLDPEWPAPHAMLAMLHYQTDNAANSEIELARALALNPEDGYSLYTLAAAYSQMIRFPKAEEALLKLVELTPESADVFARLAGLYTAQGKFQLAMDTIGQAFVLDDSYMLSYLVLAQIYVDQELLDKAFETLQQSRQALPEDRSSSSMYAYVHYLRGELSEAQRAAEEAIELNPYNGDAYRTLAFAWLDQGQIEDAYEAALEAVRLLPKSGTTHYVLGLILIERGDTAQAIHELETFLELYWDRAYAREYKDNAETLLAELKSNP